VKARQMGKRESKGAKAKARQAGMREGGNAKARQAGMREGGNAKAQP